MIRVLIERHIAESLEAAYEERSRKILQRAVAAPGFISGETLVDSRDPNHRFTLANWRSAADWERWFHSRCLIRMRKSPFLTSADLDQLKVCGQPRHHDSSVCTLNKTGDFFPVMVKLLCG